MMVLFSMDIGISSHLEISPALRNRDEEAGMARLEQAYSREVRLANADT
jgi:hypothetical protein